MSAAVDTSNLSPLLDALADAIAERAGDKLAERMPVASSTDDAYLNVDQAAKFIGDAPTSRIYDLVQRKLTPHHDGRRLLFKRADLDAYVEIGR
jgi:Helix-turn-helix domain